MSRLRDERGAALAEFSLVAAIMLAVLFGVIEIGRLMLVYTTLADAARAGARYAIVHGALRTGSGVDGPSGPSDNPPQVVTVVTNITTAAGLLPAHLTVTVHYPNGTNTTSSPVTVRAAYAYVPVSLFLPLTVNLGSTTEGMICY
jgi:Flp pilus assembly protein TadG